MRVLQEWFQSHPLISYLLIFLFSALIYNNVFRPGKLSLVKNIFLYIFMALGSLILWVLQLDRLPIIQCLGIAVILVLAVKLRHWLEMRRGKNSTAGKEAERGPSGDTQA